MSARFIADLHYNDGDLHYNDGLTVAVVIAVISSVHQLVLQLTYVTLSDTQACSQHESAGCSAVGETVQEIQEVGGFRPRVDGLCQL